MDAANRIMGTDMKERPILFSAPMVRAILSSAKTQTRRIVKWQGPRGYEHSFDHAVVDNPAGVKRLLVPYLHPEDHKSECWGDCDAYRHYCPYGDPLERLWVRETFVCVHSIPSAGVKPHPDNLVRYRADGGEAEKLLDDLKCWRPSIFMPRVYSRILLEITGVRPERLQDISEEDSIAEGIYAGHGDFEGCYWGGGSMSGTTAKECYCRLFEKINGPGSWDKNPWVWAISFRRIN